MMTIRQKFSNSVFNDLTESFVVCISMRRFRNAGDKTVSIASLTVEATIESSLRCCSSNANLMPSAIAALRSSLEIESLNLNL